MSKAEIANLTQRLLDVELVMTPGAPGFSPTRRNHILATEDIEVATEDRSAWVVMSADGLLREIEIDPHAMRPGHKRRLADQITTAVQQAEEIVTTVLDRIRATEKTGVHHGF